MTNYNNKYTPSIITEDMEHCFLCGSTRWIEVHHIFSGAFRKKSTEYGLVVPLCHWCHNEAPNGVHQNYERRLYLKQVGQTIFMQKYPNLDFIKLFGRNYL